MVAAGAAPGMKVPIAEHVGDRVVFGFRGNANQGFMVHGPKLTLPQATALVKQRMRDFHDHPGSREGWKAKVVRKYIAAQGKEFAAQLQKSLDKHGAMELGMMLSAESHSSTTDAKDFRAIGGDKDSIHLRVSANGNVKNLPVLPLIGNEGTVYSAEGAGGPPSVEGEGGEYGG